MAFTPKFTMGKVCETHTHKVHAREMHACEMHAREMHAHEISPTLPTPRVNPGQ
jgi:hypothetical protein